MVKLNKIYTRTGDKGSAGLVDGSRVSKSSARMAAIGDVDEANAAIGVAIAALDGGALRDHLLTIQNDLFDLGADLSTPVRPDQAQRLRITEAYVSRLEAWCDEFNAGLRPLDSFILPGGTPAAALLHLLPRIRDIRRFGSCALDLCGVAQGSLDGYLEEGVNLWDHAAGGLIASAAGARVETAQGVGGRPIVIAAPEGGFDEFRSAIAEAGYLAVSGC